MTEARDSTDVERLTVLTAGALVGLLAGLQVWTRIDFTRPDAGDIVGWVTVHGYPKQQEIAAFWGAFPCALTGAGASWWAWRSVGSRWLVPCILLVLAALTVVAPIPLVAIVGVALVLALVLSQGSIASGDEWTGGRWPLWLAIGASVGLYFGTFSGEGLHGHALDLYLDGELLSSWHMVMQGAVPYRDFFVNQGLFNNVGKAALAGWGGTPTVFDLRLVQTFLEPTFYVAAFWMGRRAFQSDVTAVGMALLAYGMRVTWLDRQTFAIVTLALLGIALSGVGARVPETASARSALSTREQRLALFGAGCATVAAFFYSTEMGLAAGMACGIALLAGSALIRLSLTPFAIYAAGVVAAFVPMAAYLLAHEALGAFVQNTWTQLTYQSSAWALPFPPLLPSSVVPTPTEMASADWPGLARAYLAPAAYIGVAVSMFVQWKERGANRRWLLWLALLVYGVFLFQVALGRSDEGHVRRGGYFSLFLLAAVAEQWWVTRWRTGRLVSAIAVPLLMLVAVQGLFNPARGLAAHAWRIAQGRTWPQQQPAAWAPLGGIGVDPADAANHQRVAEEIERLLPPDATFFDFSNQGAYYVFTGRPVPSRFVLISYGASRADQAQVVQEIETVAVPLVLASGPTFFNQVDGLSQDERHPIVAEYLRREFTELKKVSGTTFLVRRGWAVDASGRLVRRAGAGVSNLS